MNFERIKNSVVLTVSYLFILLFVYAAVSKLLEYDSFQIELGQSPLLSAYAGWVAPSILSLELLVAFLLMFSKTRYLGLTGSYFLMVLFSVYIYLILHYSSFVPCSCGGVLEKMTWQQHLIFNLVFVFLAGFSLFFIRLGKVTFLVVFVGGFFQFGLLYGLFVLSENSLKYDNPFVRRFSDFVVKDREIDLQFNSYYYAGSKSDTLFLGNYMSPLVLTSVDTALHYTHPKRLTVDQEDLPFKSVNVQIDSTNFYFFDGSVPCLLKGKLQDRKAKLVGLGSTLFSVGVPIDSSRLLIRTHNSLGENTIGVTSYATPFSSYFNDSILEKQVDGNFDTDGMLHYDSFLQRGVYVYRYRNQYMVFNPSLKQVTRGNTIDTIRTAQLKVVYDHVKREKKLAGAPLVVNYNSSVYNGLLFVQSGLVGRFEDKKMWQQASVIDVYSILNQTYIASFYVYHIDQKKVSRFFVYDKHFYAFIGTKLVGYALTDMITSAYFQPNHDKKNIPAGSRGKVENLYNRVDQ